ncbi:Gfo/Idh/MocA family oxidoreductase [Oscillospiraceae bacterium OttesenSCG-928-F05]|nr:Gfo/Idh/MocA family oxidoreductase [Oscillospiraceae bacterium OttesenSCG-928-F05]
MKKVITYGSFDLLHEGHVNLLRRAKALGDYLIVGITTEQYDATRGKMNVIDGLIDRIDNVRATGFADEIIIEDHEGQKLEDIQRLGVDVFTVGSDWIGVFDFLKDYCQVVYLERTSGISSTMVRKERRGILRMGVVGCGRIARRFVPEAKYVSGLSLDGVFNPRPESARTFAETYELGFYESDYAAFLEKLDAVYIASPHETHFDYAKRALEAGKHVLCEKPMVLVRREAEALFALAKQNGLVLMEAVKTAYAPGFMSLIAQVKSGKIGRVCDVEASFTKLIPPDSPREFGSACGGSFTELASYPLMAVFKLLGRDFVDLRFEALQNEDGLDVYAKAFFRYGDALATVKTGLGVKSEGQLLVSGTNGYILAKSPWWLTRSFDVCYENPEQNEPYTASFRGTGLRYEMADFVRQVWDKNAENFKLSAEDSIAMAEVMERFLAYRKDKA